jgi:hypothetical protein
MFGPLEHRDHGECEDIRRAGARDMIVRLIKPWMFPDAEVRYPARQFNLSGVPPLRARVAW